MTRPSGRRDGVVERFDIADLPGVWNVSTITLTDHGALAGFAGSDAASAHTAVISYAGRGEFEQACREHMK